RLKMILVGDTDCGKSELQKKLGYGFEKDHYEIVLGVDFSVLDADTSKMQLWQITEQERFNEVSKRYYSGASIITIVFDISRPETLERTPYWAARVKKAVSKAPILIIGNKIDLVKNYSIEDLEKATAQILSDFPYMHHFEGCLEQLQGRKGFSEINKIPVVEVSALQKINISTVIEILENLIIRHNEVKKQDLRKKKDRK
ncbi:MAG: ADP-ribosylation factor-like protein, partial [Promethearchaeota archaeon]